MSRSDIRSTADQRRRWVDWHITYCAGTPNKEFNEKAQEILAETDVSPAEEAAADPSEREVAERYSLLKEAYVSASSTPLSWLGMLAIARKSLRLEQLAVDNAVAQLTSQRDAAVEAYNAAISHAQNAEAQIGAANKRAEEAEVSREEAVKRAEKAERDTDEAEKRAEKAERELTEAKATIGKAEASRNAWRTRAEKVECEQRKIVESLREVINIAVRSQ